MTGEDFFVSIAPFKTETYPCTFHSLTSCHYELANKTFQVTVENESSNTISDKELTAEANRFIDLWLPRNGTYSVSITNELGSVHDTITTFADSPTCITIMQLTL